MQLLKNPMYKYSYLVLSAVLLYSCSSYNASSIYGDADTINIDNAIEEKEILLSSIVESPTTIVLETKDNCIIQNVRSIELFNNKIYILDDKSNKLYVFNMDGSFHMNISEEGRGHGEYIELSDFSIDRNKNVIYLLDEAMDVILKYDLNTGKFISSIKTERNGYRSYSMLVINDKIYLNKTSTDEKDMYELKEVDPENGEQTNTYLESTEYNFGWNIPLRLPFSNFYSKNTEYPKYVGMFSNTIVGITSSGIIPKYTIVSKDFVNKHDVDAIKEKFNKDYFHIDMNNVYESNKIYQISRIVDIPGMLIFKYMKGPNCKFLLYDINSKESKTSNMLMNDYVADDNIIPMDLCYSDKDGVVSILQTNYIPYFIEHFIQKEKVKKNIDNYEKITTINEHSNPVLFYHKYKK